MIDHVWTVFCTRSSIDSESNNISLFEVIEEMTVVGPLQQPGNVAGPFDLVTLWTRTVLDQPVSGEARWSVLTPAGKKIDQNVIAIELTKFHRLRMRTRITSLTIDALGVLWFVGELRLEGAEKWTEFARVPVEIKAEPSSQSTSG